MINKFRYKKPQNSANKAKLVDSEKKCVADDADNAETRGVLDDKTKKKLQELFSQLQFSNETALPPDALRRALAESFFDQQRFQLGFMDDAAECFENMLLRIHMHIAHGEAEDMCSARHCIPHQKFAMTLVEQSVCKSCGATSEPLSYTQMVHYVSTSTLVYQVRNGRPQGVVEPFGQLLRKAGSMGDVRVCPSACGAVIQISRTLMNRPEIVSVGLVWNSERPTLEHIMEVFSSIGTTLRLSEVFNTVVDSRWAETCVHNLVGVVTYYGKHYSTFFFHTKLRVWIYFDDATVREVGPRWEQVVDKCRKGRYQPLLLLYALPDGTPVNTENAPKQVTAFYNDKPINKKPPMSSSQAILRRSITPSPEKPNVGNTRRAITPNPDQKPPLPRTYNEYQNLSVIQNNIYNQDVVDGDLSPRKQLNIHRTLSNGSSSGTEGLFSNYLNVPRTRDSGNWSSDRNSASSSSSTTMENPYSYLLAKVSNPTTTQRIESSSSNSSGVYDVGYDSYSLSSNDSTTMTTIQHLMKMGHLAKIPEDYNTNQQVISQSCDVLCDEADELLVKSRQMEDDHDLVLALALCNAAATKARAAMDAPYNNPQTLTLARMKHNTCIMRARSLHRRMTQNSLNQGKDVPPEIRHTREGSSGSGKHSRQNSRDKGNHSRQNSKELLHPSPQEKPCKNIEIYATLPKKKDALKKIVNIDEDLYDKPPGRESRSIFSRSKNKDKTREKRSRSEDRNKMSHDFSIAPENKDVKKAKEEEKKEKPKKQHKIRRKLLMGGLIRRKNRSMPDLSDAADKEKPTLTVDDSSVGIKGSGEASMCGYLSEGHLEFSGSANPNLERSKLMRKSFHGSAGKILTAAKVPPPPPLRTTSQLSTSKLNGETERPKHPLPDEGLQYQFYNAVSYLAPQSNMMVCRSDAPYNAPQLNTVVTRADVHQEQEKQQIDSGIDEVDCMPTSNSIELPPYPSPHGSAIHSRQASEEFPPPPPPLDLSALDEHLKEQTTPHPASLLAQLQNKRQEILSQDIRPNYDPIRTSGDTWLKELQAKQAALRMKKSQTVEIQQNCETQKPDKASSVKDLASKFENIQVQPQNLDDDSEDGKRKLSKKKSVSFCDQVILVATAEEQEDDSYIPNPILERVLRSAMNKHEAAVISQEVMNLRQEVSQEPQPGFYEEKPQQPLYVRRNSVDNLLSKSDVSEADINYVGSYDRQLYGSSPQYGNNLQVRPSPYQRIPQNSPAYYNAPAYPTYPTPKNLNQQYNPPRSQIPEVRQSPTPHNYPTQQPHPVYQHPPSPAPSSVSSNYNYQQNLYRLQYSPCHQRIPPDPNCNVYQHDQTYPPYQQIPGHYYPEMNVQRYPDPYQRVPPPHLELEQLQYQQYQPKQLLKKTVSFEPGTKGGAESPTPKAIVTPIIVNNANNSVPTGKTKCNLCRKKAVVSSNLYCTDCEFYMSRFKPKR